MNDAAQIPPTFPKVRSKNKQSKRLLLLIAIIGTIVLGTISWLLGTTINHIDAQNGTKRIDGLTPVFLTLLLALTLAAGLAWNLKFWRTMDEAARRAHLDAFYWGGSISWMLLVPLVALPLKINGFTFSFIETLDMNASQIFGFGIGAALMTTFVGYGVAWLIWWATKR